MGWASYVEERPKQSVRVLGKRLQCVYKQSYWSGEKGERHALDFAESTFWYLNTELLYDIFMYGYISSIKKGKSMREFWQSLETD